MNADDASPAIDGADDAAGQADTVEARLAALEAENAELKDRVLRVLAEEENTRRRAERDMRDARTYAISGFAREALVVADNLRRTIEAAGDAGTDPALRTLLDGVEMTEREFLKVLDRNGVKRVDPKGERFDPNLHQAMFEVPDASVPNGTVMQVVQAGFKIGDRVLRPAMVGVSKGGPKAVRPEGETAAG
jgi:molecular chaperone GrpE